MKFFVPSNWQPDLISKVKKPGVEELYGKLRADFVGGGRSSAILPPVSERKAAQHIREAHQNNLKFNYLLNAVSLDNLELTRAGQKKLRSLIDWLIDIRVDGVTVSIPYLLRLIKKNYPQLKVSVSIFAGINSVERAKYWEELGADELALSPFDLTRNFSLLRKIRKNIKCKLKLIANLNCLYHCPFFLYHGVLESHSSQSFHSGFMVDWCRISCRYRQLKDPLNFIRATWIRPEDLHYYEEVGIDRIKLVNRTWTTKAISTVVTTYLNQRYDGNLLDLFSSPAKDIAFQKRDFFREIRYYFHPFKINVFKLYQAKNLLGEAEIYIDNRALDGFIEHFLKEDCATKSCEECGYCARVAEKVVKIDPASREEYLKRYKQVLDELNSGRMFKYF